MPNGGVPTAADFARENSGDIRELTKRVHKLEVDVEELRLQVREQGLAALKYVEKK